MASLQSSKVSPPVIWHPYAFQVLPDIISKFGGCKPAACMWWTFPILATGAKAAVVVVAAHLQSKGALCPQPLRSGPAYIHSVSSVEDLLDRGLLVTNRAAVQ